MKPSSRTTVQESPGTDTDTSAKCPPMLSGTSALAVWDRGLARWGHLLFPLPELKLECRRVRSPQPCSLVLFSVRASVRRHQPRDPVPVTDRTMGALPSKPAHLGDRRSQELLPEVSSQGHVSQRSYQSGTDHRWACEEGWGGGSVRMCARVSDIDTWQWLARQFTRCEVFMTASSQRFCVLKLVCVDLMGPLPPPS